MINGSGTPAAADLAGAPPVKGTLNAIVVDQDDTISQGILSHITCFWRDFYNYFDFNSTILFE